MPSNLGVNNYVSIDKQSFQTVDDAVKLIENGSFINISVKYNTVINMCPPLMLWRGYKGLVVYLDMIFCFPYSWKM